MQHHESSEATKPAVAPSFPWTSDLYRRVWHHMTSAKIGREVRDHEIGLRVIYMRKRDEKASEFQIYQEPSELQYPYPLVRIFRAGIDDLTEDREEPDPEHAEQESELFSLVLSWGFFSTWLEWHQDGDDRSARWFRYFEAAYRRDGILQRKPNYVGQALTSEECDLIREEHLLAVEYGWRLLQSLGFADREYVDRWSAESWRNHETFLAYARKRLTAADLDR
jgi:hypothetical protein